MSDSPEPHVLALHDQLLAHARDAFPEESDRWHRVWVQRVAWYELHQGDMTGAPEFPSDDTGARRG